MSKKLVIYLVAEPETPELARAAVEGGADVVELGFPFSDPLAEGPVIRRASERALARGMRTRECLDVGDAGDHGEPPGDAQTFGLDLHDKASAQHLDRKLRHRAHQHDVTGLEQGDAIADALNLIKHMGRQQHCDAFSLELSDQAQKLLGRLRIEARRRLVQDRDLGALHDDLGQAQPLPHAA